MEPIVINRRKNEKWQSIEVARAHFNSMKLIKSYKIAFSLAAVILAVVVAYKIAAKSYSDLTLIASLLAAALVFTLWIFIKPSIDGRRMYFEGLLASGDGLTFETRLYDDKIELASEGETLSSLPLSRAVNAFETKNLYEIILLDEEETLVGHMLLKSGFEKGTLSDVKRIIPPGQKQPKDI